MNPKSEAGLNIVLKIPKRTYKQSISFYWDVLHLEVEEKPIGHLSVSRTHKVKFGPNILWLDCVNTYTRPETWLELNTPDLERSVAYLREKGIETCDEIEQISDGHWIADPAGAIFVLKNASPHQGS